MTRVDFYKLQDVELDAMHRFACALAGKAFAAGSKVVMHASDKPTAQHLDTLLWQYPEKRFIPHGLCDHDDSEGAPVVITWTEPESFEGVLVNLTDGVPDFFGRFDRVAEIIVRSNTEAGRERYAFYRDRGFPLFYHELDDWEAE